MKSGTTELAACMKQHPQIIWSRSNEVHYFDLNFDRGSSWYRNQFPRTRTIFSCVGEKSPYYLFHPLAAFRAHAVCLHAKIIILLRNPIDRAYSHYQFNIRENREFLSFEEAIQAESDRITPAVMEQVKKGEYHFNHQWYSYLSRGIYVDQIKEWQKYYPNNQILIIRSEDFRDDPDRVVNRIFSFLGLRPFHPQLRNTTPSSYLPMDALTRQWLFYFFEPHNRALEVQVNQKFHWQ